MLSGSYVSTWSDTGNSMTFDEQYPDADTWFQPGDPDHEVIKVPGEPKPCWQCGIRTGTLTRFVELNFEARVCSESCNDAGWKEYFEACRRSGGGEPGNLE